MKKYGWTRLLLLYAYVLQISGPVLSGTIDADADDPRTREKRSVICLLGLTDLIKDTLYSSLEDTRKQDPLPLDDAWKGQLHDGVLRGLSTLTNTTELEVFCNEDDLIIFTTTLRMENAEVWYKWTRRVLFKLKGSVWMKAKEVDFDLEVHLNSTNGLNFEVINSLITKVDKFEVGLKGLGILNPIAKQILKLLYKSWKETVAKKIGLLLKKALENKLGRVARSFDWIPFL